MPSIRRFIGSRLVYTPLMAIVIFLVVMAIILGTLQVQERQQQEGSLFRELSLVKQRIQLRFVNNSEALQSFSRDLAQTQNDRVARDKVLAQIESFVLGNPEILQLIWLNDNEWRQWMVPPIIFHFQRCTPLCQRVLSFTSRITLAQLAKRCRFQLA